jgi:hypothetical protein
MNSSRQEVIELVTQAVMSDRNQDYAPPEQNFQRIADLWNVYLEGRSEVTPYDTSIMMVLVKVARMMQSPHLVDHLVDVAGYAACAADVLPDAPQPELPLEDAPVVEAPAVKSSPVAVEGLTGDVSYNQKTNMYKVVLDNGGKRVFMYDDWHTAVRTGVAEYLQPDPA